MARDSLFWGIRGSLYLLRDLNCALASMEVVQDMAGKREDPALRGATGLEGGLVARGSTCGVVTGGSLGIALAMIDEIEADGEAARRRVMEEVREYVHWFGSSFGTTLCRERTGVDFYTLSGQLRYLLPGDRFSRCMWHIGRTTSHLKRRMALTRPVESQRKDFPDQARHCATEVLRGVHAACGTGNDVLEKIAFVLDGGVGFTGGVCGALAGAVMAANLAFGWDIRAMGIPCTIREFVVGHLNLLRKTKAATRETFAIGREILKSFDGRVSSLECVRITRRSFSGWDDFQDHLRASAPCHELIDQAILVSSEAITRCRPL